MTATGCDNGACLRRGRIFLAACRDFVQLQSRVCSLAVVELQHGTKSLSTLDVACNGINILTRLNQLIAQSLMVPLRLGT